jgi:hypothetical protein
LIENRAFRGRQNGVIPRLAEETMRHGKKRTNMTDEEEQALRTKLAQLTEEHRDLDVAILALMESGAADLLELSRLKKRKLLLKDQITQIEDSLLPDIIA